ncbi:Mss4-like protein [Pseudocohnilembus persalinus]|uniref:peptide-methionine (R)-S-oxide reductase n=1 Tax=Pseudocohnilembus persalinus TaxID=266149 RepID=A0A0V0QR85_PSEPJ|nr:Mss4-like protein [Pseudocohnilembus persalinus]|eukprot:KRX04772.1 Mss4-like protein [Pseudocohnilembus persalinus]
MKSLKLLQKQGQFLKKQQQFINKGIYLFSATQQQQQQQNLNEEQTNQSIKIDRYSMTPHEYYITQGNAMERPFTGKTWYIQDVGYYHCTVCESKLFSFDQKVQNNTGMATFWNHIEGAVKTQDVPQDEAHENCKPNLVNVHQVQEQEENQNQQNKEYKQCLCSKCNSHLGLVFSDGGPPTFLRYSINSASAKFVLKEHWQDPNELKKQKNDKNQKQK